MLVTLTNTTSPATLLDLPFLDDKTLKPAESIQISYCAADLDRQSDMKDMVAAGKLSMAIVMETRDGVQVGYDLVPSRTRVALTTPVAVVTADSTVITKLTSPGAVAVTLPASPILGQTIQIIDGTGDASSNNITITPAAGTINGGANVVINTNFGRAILVRSPTEWLSVLTASISSGAAGGDLTGTYPNPTIGANKVTEAKLSLTVAGLQNLSGAGAVDVTHRTTYYTSTGAGQALTLADGTTAGQRKTIVHAVDGGSGTLTPANPEFFATVVFTNVRDAVELEWTGSKWRVVGYSAVTFT